MTAAIRSKSAVVVKEGQSARLRCGGDQEIGHLAPSLMLGREQTLDLPGASHVIGRHLDQIEGLKGLRELVPFGCVSR